MPPKLSLLPPGSPRRAAGMPVEDGPQASLPTLTPTPGGNASMALRGGTLYVRLSSAEAALTACDHDRAAALGHLFGGRPAAWPLAGEPEADTGRRRAAVPAREAALLLDLPALLPTYTWAAQSGPPETPLIVSAAGAAGTVTVGITSATYERHRSAATLGWEIANTVRHAGTGLAALNCTI